MDIHERFQLEDKISNILIDVLPIHFLKAGGYSDEVDTLIDEIMVLFEEELG